MPRARLKSKATAAEEIETGARQLSPSTIAAFHANGSVQFSRVVEGVNPCTVWKVTRLQRKYGQVPYMRTFPTHVEALEAFARQWKELTAAA